MICKLCSRNEADQTGSHITSAFLVTSQIGKRGQERGHLLTTDPNQDYTQNVGDMGIKEDYMFCRGCEKRLGIIEGIYASEITRKIEQHQFTGNFDKRQLDAGNYTLSCKRVHPVVFQLLILSNIWRASLSTFPLYAHFKLSPSLEERIRFNLDLFLPVIVDGKSSEKEKKWLETVERCKDLFDVIPLLVVKAENIQNKEFTYEFFDSDSKKPYQMILNEYFLFLFEGDIVWEDDFLELKSEFELDDVLNQSVDNCVLAVVSNERYFQGLEKVKMLGVRQRFQNIQMECLADFARTGRQATPKALAQAIYERVHNIS